MKTSDLFIQCLEAHNVKYVFGVPGEENLDLLESLRTSSIELIITRNEQTAVFMAATHGRLTGEVGVALATLGPWATNMMTGVAHAQLGWFPVLVITGQKPIKKSKQGQFQVIDVAEMMDPITKFSKVIVDGARVPSLVSQAIHMAQTERPGAVHLELPEDIAGEEINGYKPIKHTKIRRPIPDQKAIQSCIATIQNAKRPMVLVGAWANRKRITKYLSKFVQEYNIPFFTSQMGKGVLDERLPQFIGTAALTTNDHIHAVIACADLIIAVGHDTVEKPTHYIEGDSTDVMHINFSPAAYDELYKPSLEIIGDIGSTFWQLSEATIDTNNHDFAELYQKATVAKETLNRYAKQQYNSNTMMPARLIHEIRELLSEDDIVALDNGLYKVRFARNYRTYKPNTLLLDNALATMGAWYSTGMMAKILNPDHHVVVVTGDGGLMMNLGDLETAVRLWLDMTIVVVNDNAYGMIKRKQHDHGYEDFGLDLVNPDFVALAEAFGASGHRIETDDAFKNTLQIALEEKGVSIIEVPFVYPDTIE